MSNDKLGRLQRQVETVELRLANLQYEVKIRLDCGDVAMADRLLNKMEQDVALLCHVRELLDKMLRVRQLLVQYEPKERVFH